MLTHRRKTIAIAGVILLVLGVLGGAFHALSRDRAGVEQRSRNVRQALDQCLAYAPAPSTLVLELSANATQAGGAKETGHVPPCVSDLYQFSGSRMPLHSVLFTHRLTHEFSGDALVIVGATPVRGTSPDMKICISQWFFNESVVDAVGYETSFSKLRSDTALSKPIDSPVRFFAGQHDPADPSRFTIEYEAPNERGTIVGVYESWARDGVSLTIRQR